MKPKRQKNYSSDSYDFPTCLGMKREYLELIVDASKAVIAARTKAMPETVTMSTNEYLNMQKIHHTKRELKEQKQEQKKLSLLNGYGTTFARMHRLPVLGAPGERVYFKSP